LLSAMAYPLVCRLLSLGVRSIWLALWA